MQHVYILIGAPACGKTRWALSQARQLNVSILSADIIRDDIRRAGGDPFDGDRVFSEMGRRLDQLLAEGASIIVDATHWQRQYRAYALTSARAAGAKTIGVWFDISLDVCLQRNDRRSGTRPGLRREDPETLRRIHAGLEPPGRDEFDEIRRITFEGLPSRDDAVEQPGLI